MFILAGSALGAFAAAMLGKFTGRAVGGALLAFLAALIFGLFLLDPQMNMAEQMLLLRGGEGWSIAAARDFFEMASTTMVSLILGVGLLLMTRRDGD